MSALIYMLEMNGHLCAGTSSAVLYLKMLLPQIISVITSDCINLTGLLGL